MTKDYPSEMLRGALNRKAAPWMRALLLAVSTAVFFGFAWHARYATLDSYGSWQMDELLLMTAVMFTAVFALSFGVQLRFARSQPLSVCLLLAVVTGAVVLAKVSLLDYVSDDYTIFLNNWISEYAQMGIREGLGSYIGSDYTPPYLYLMLVISRFPDYPWLYMVKLISLLFEVLMAYAMLRLATLRARGEGVPLLLYHMTMILPTVMFNGAYWGQCDAIYTGFCLLALYLALSDRPCRSMLCFGVALSFKLQTVFFLPALLPLWLQKKVKLRHLPLIPAMYMVMMLPALWGGKSLHHVLTCYMQQAGQYNFLTVNAPCLYQLFPMAEIDGNVLYAMFSPMAMALGFAALAACCLPVCVHRDRLNAESTLLFTTLTLASVAFVLPKMHERYTFGADVLSLALCVFAPRRIALPLLFGLASYICYKAGLPGDSIMALRWAALFQLAAIVLTAVELARTLRAGNGAMEVKA